MLRQVFFTLSLTILASSLVAAQQSGDSCPNPIEYESHNQITLSPLSLRAVSGRAITQDRVSVPGVCLGLFTEQDRQLVASSVTDDEGYFHFRNIPSGVYRLVVKDKYDGFCTANVRIRIVHWPRGGIFKRKRLVVYMRVSGVDTCSYGDYK
jgi:hypothetical protein